VKQVVEACRWGAGQGVGVGRGRRRRGRKVYSKLMQRTERLTPLYPGVEGGGAANGGKDDKLTRPKDCETVQDVSL
jgi:hypothetical protein